MYIETTTCISYNHLSLVKLYALEHKMSVSSFLAHLIAFAVQCEKLDIRCLKRLRYRKRNGGSWKRVHLVLFQDEYEYFLDVRKLWKMSIANVIAYCLDNVLQEFLNFLTRVEQDEDYYTDNYRLKGYAFDFCIEEEVFCIKLYWGPHPEIIKKALLSA